MLNDRVIVVTGAARGIGLAIAAASARAGATVVMVDRLADGLTGAAVQLCSDGLKAEPRPCELTDAVAVAQLFDIVATAHGRIDGLVNNAGTTVYGGALDTGWADLAEVLRIHLAPTLLCTQAAVRHMLPR